jgi:hypothetical protein
VWGWHLCWLVSAFDHNLGFWLGDILCVRRTFGSGFKVFFSENETAGLDFQFLKNSRRLWFTVL